MRKPTPAESAPIDTPVPRTFFSRMFRWGIGFWLLLWIGAACVRSGAGGGIKGGPPVRVGVCYGSVWCGMDLNRSSPTNKFEFCPTTFIWSRSLSPLREEVYLDIPKDFPTLLGPFIVRPSRSAIAFPISGLLWLWLVWGWWLEPRRKEVWRRRRVVRIAILALLPAMSLVATHSYKQGATFSTCYLNIRNIQQAIRGYQGTHELIDGSAVPWSAIIGPGGYMPKPRCPSGCEYELSPVVPEIGKTAARCPNPEHRRRLEERGTVGW